MELTLTRRSAVRALAAMGLTSGGALALSELSVRRGTDQEKSISSDSETNPNETIRTMTALAAVVYPSTVTVTPEFVESYVREGSNDHAQALSRAARDLNAGSRAEHGVAFYDIPAEADRDALLRSMGVDRVAPDRDGTVPERVRYYLVNGLLYALFTDPQGSELVGITNPVGHPGGYRGK